MRECAKMTSPIAMARVTMTTALMAKMIRLVPNSLARRVCVRAVRMTRRLPAPQPANGARMSARASAPAKAPSPLAPSSRASPTKYSPWTARPPT